MYIHMYMYVCTGIHYWFTRNYIAPPPPPQSPFSGEDEEELFDSICNSQVSYSRFLEPNTINFLDRVGYLPTCSWLLQYVAYVTEVKSLKKELLYSLPTTIAGVGKLAALLEFCVTMPANNHIIFLKCTPFMAKMPYMVHCSLVPRLPISFYLTCEA